MSSKKNVRIVSLNNGTKLSIEYTKEFDEKLRKFLNVYDRELTDDEISRFIITATVNAIDKSNF